MSCTEIYGFGESGKVELYAEVRNAFRGAMAVWRLLEEKYLPSLEPMWLEPDENKYWSRTIRMFREDSMKEIWGLFKNEKVSYSDKIIIGSTFDDVLIEGDNLEELLSAFYNFEGETSLKEQADAIKSMIQNTKITAIGFNQTSVCDPKWPHFHYDEVKDEYNSYNIFKDKEHWFLFEELSKQIPTIHILHKDNFM